MALDLSKLTNKKIKAAITAFQSGDGKAWFPHFTSEVVFYDDENQVQFNNYFKKALGHEYFTSIERVENNGLHIYGDFHSYQWGNFRMLFKFQLDKTGQICRLDIGQAD